MIRAFAAVAFLTAALYIHADNADAALYAGITAVVLIVWAARDVDWRNPFKRPRRLDGIPATPTMQRVLGVLLTDARDLNGLRIGQLARAGSGGVYICLDRLEMAGWAVGEWEFPEPVGRPRRRFYRLTPQGRARALELLGLRERPEAQP